MMFVLVLNAMTANAEQGSPVCRAETAEELLAFLEAETVEPYQDGQWGKTYRQGGPLEWYNPPWPAGQQPGPDDTGSIRDEYWGQGVVNVGTREDAAARWDAEILAIPEIP